MTGSKAGSLGRGRWWLGLAVAVAFSGCGPSPAPTASAAPPVCIVQEDWERHEGAFSGALEAAVSAVAPRDGAGGTTEARLAASEVRAMGGLAAGTNPGVAAHLQAAADALEAAATAFGTPTSQPPKHGSQKPTMSTSSP